MVTWKLNNERRCEIMRFGKTIDLYVATNIITYKLVEYSAFGQSSDAVYSIWKCDTQHDKITNICKCVCSRDAVMLIWEDVKKGVQK